MCSQPPPALTLALVEWDSHPLKAGAGVDSAFGVCLVGNAPAIRGLGSHMWSSCRGIWRFGFRFCVGEASMSVRLHLESPLAPHLGPGAGIGVHQV